MSAKGGRTAPDEVVAIRKPTRISKRWKMPKGCDIQEFVMREVTGQDEIEAAIWAEKGMTTAQSSSAMAIYSAQRRECMRLALVEVDGAQVNHDGIPFKQMDYYSIKTMLFLTYAFNKMNGVEDDELKNFEAGAETE